MAVLKYWKLIGLGILCLLLAVQTVRISSLKNDVERQKIANNELRAELKRISTAKNEQKIVTVERIKVAERGNRQADEIAKKIEQAPVEPGACKTPDIIMGSDI